MVEDQIQAVQDWMEANSDLPVAQQIGQLALDYLNSL